jgi:hypothetical protein
MIYKNVLQACYITLWKRHNNIALLILFKCASKVARTLAIRSVQALRNRTRNEPQRRSKTGKPHCTPHAGANYKLTVHVF